MADEGKEVAGHTPLPWASEGKVQRVNGGTGQHDDLWCGNILPARAGKYRGEIARIQSADQIRGISVEEAAANAAFIVKAVNNHDDLITAFRRIVSLDEKNVQKYAQEIASSALAKAGAA